MTNITADVLLTGQTEINKATKEIKILVGLILSQLRMSNHKTARVRWELASDDSVWILMRNGNEWHAECRLIREGREHIVYSDLQSVSYTHALDIRKQLNALVDGTLKTFPTLEEALQPQISAAIDSQILQWERQTMTQDELALLLHEKGCSYEETFEEGFAVVYALTFSEDRFYSQKIGIKSHLLQLTTQSFKQSDAYNRLAG